MIMGMQLHTSYAHINQLLLSETFLPKPHKLFFSCNSTTGKCAIDKEIKNLGSFPIAKGIRKRGLSVISSSSSRIVAAPSWDAWAPEKSSKAPSLSDVIWPSAGAFAAMAILGKVDQMLAPKGISMTIAPIGAVCAVLFASPSSPGARKYNMFVAQIGCAAIGVVVFSIFGPGWLARSTALAAALAFMIFTRSVHPPAASLPLLFIDGIKLHHLNFWYALFPGAAGCILLCLLVGLIGFTYENVYQFFFYSSKLILISVEITALALFYHIYNGVRHLLTDFSGFGRKIWKFN